MLLKESKRDRDKMKRYRERKIESERGSNIP